MKKGIVLIAVCWWGIASFAREYGVANQRKFEAALRTSSLAIVLFIDSDQVTKDGRAEMRELKRNFRRAGRHEPDVTCITVDVAKQGSWPDLYEVKRHTKPFFMLFKSRKPARDKEKNQIVLEGFATTLQINDFIRTHFKDELQAIEQVRREEAERRAEQARINALYWGPWWGYPYYYPYGYGYYPGFYFGGYYGGRGWYGGGHYGGHRGYHR